MTVYNTAYDTTACNKFRMNKTVSAILEAMVRDGLPSADGVAYIEHSNSANSEVPAFKHALYIHKWDNVQDHRGARASEYEPILAIDVRPAGRIDKTTGRYKVTNSLLYKSLVFRGVLTSRWLTNGTSVFRSVAPVATSIFSVWLSEAIAYKYNLDPLMRIQLRILAAIFYQSNHQEGVEFDKHNEARILAGIANSLGVNVTDVARIYDITKCITGIEDFCTKVKQFTENVRLENFNAGVLVALMGSTWTNAEVEMSAVALEHPPTWITLLYEASTNKAVRNTGLSKICERRQFVEPLNNLGLMIKQMAPDTIKMIEQNTLL